MFYKELIMNKDKKINEMSFEEALGELQNIVQNIESGKENLEDTIKQYERGNALKEHCDKKLKEAKLRIDKIMQQGDTLSLTKLDEEV